MPSERLQRRIDAFLDRADEAAHAFDWPVVREAARAVLGIDPENEDALGFIAMAESAASGQPAASAAATDSPATDPTGGKAAHPDSFAGGRYRVQRALGEGARKRVYLAHDELLDRDVALALIKTEGLDDVGRERVVREAQAMGRLGTHPHLVAVLDFGQEASNSGPPTAFIVTEYMPGGSVGELLANGPLETAQALEVASGVARGLAFAHEQGVVHRDLKPGNVWLAADGSAKIGDFGLAVSLDQSRLTQHGMMIGTVAYMPPEQALGGEVTPRSDLYSLGAMLYELVTGRPPFAGDDPTAVISQHINTRPVAPSWHSEHCPPELEALILRLLEKAPEDRPASATEVLEALARVDPSAKSASRDSSANPLDRLARGVFVGREGELERLRATADEAFAGRGGVVMLVGEPGIGKTRTAHELETYARMRGAQVLWGRAHEDSGAPAYWPWVQVGRAWGRANDVAALAEVLEGAGGELVRLFPELPGILGQEPQELPLVADESAQFRLFDAYASFLRAASEGSPLTIVLDDIHWADKPTLLLLQHLAREVHNARILLVGTYRDTELARTHPLSEALAELNREGGFHRVVLRGLAEPEVRSYLHATTGREPSSDLVSRIHDETEGNPFFLAEVVNLLAEEGRLDDSVSDIALPDGVREALGRRLDRLSEEANELLTIASVVGREFEYETLKLLTEHGDDELLRLIEEGLGARVVEELPQAGRYRFTHALMQETLLAELSTTRLVRLHGRVGEAIERQYGEHTGRRAANLALHFMESAALNREHAGKAASYSSLAGAQAQRASAMNEAIRHYTNWLSIARDADDDVATIEPETLRQLAFCERQAGSDRETALAQEHYEQALTLYEAAGDVIGAAKAAADLARFHVTQRLTAAERHRIALRALDSLGERDTRLRVDLLLIAGGTSRADSSADSDGERYYTNAERLMNAHAGDWRQERAQLLKLRGFDAGRHGDVGRLRDLWEQARELFTTVGNLYEAAQTYPLSLDFSVPIEQYIQEMREAAELAARVGARRAEILYRVMIGERLMQQADWDAAAGIFDKLPPDYVIASSLAALMADIRGERQAAQRITDATVVTSLPSQGCLLGARMRRLWIEGRQDLAARAAEDAREFVMSTEPDTRTLGTVGTRADFVAPLLLEDDAALRLYEFARPSAVAFAGFSSWLPALALRFDGEAESERLAQGMLDYATENGLAIPEGSSLQALAEVAERRGEHEQAIEYLDRAGELFSRHGAKLYLDQVLAKKAELAVDRQ